MNFSTCRNRFGPVSRIDKLQLFHLHATACALTMVIGIGCSHGLFSHELLSRTIKMTVSSPPNPSASALERWPGSPQKLIKNFFSQQTDEHQLSGKGTKNIKAVLLYVRKTSSKTCAVQKAKIVFFVNFSRHFMRYKLLHH